MNAVLLFDTETTSVENNVLLSDKHKPYIIEFFGRIIGEDNETLEEMEFLCKPPVPVPDEVTRITGLTDADLKDAPPFSAKAKELAEFIHRADAICAHNLRYDWTVVNTEFARVGISTNNHFWPDTRICTVEQSEWVKGYRLSLTGLHEHLFGHPFDGAHRARSDVDALTRCFIEMRKRRWV